MTTTTPSRRSATVAAIKATARRLLRSGGPAAISLRAIAREMGMTAPAIYRYFPGLDALVVDLTGDLFAELRDAVDRPGDDDPLVRLAEMGRRFRRWALANPGEFALAFGSPVPGVTQFDRHCLELTDGGARFGEVFLDTIAAVYAVHPPPPMPANLGDPGFLAALQPYRDAHGDRFPLPVVSAFLIGWTRLYGLVAIEVFGHLRWAVTDVEPLFEAELSRTITGMTGGA
ncbi:TetR/AcrR family transcriptional regulator [Spirilliplanes yamanashiensis]|uniref:TetR family transcriptional regulator n=1 Tax=Spirilliplanes yamanashiensis TaxID=42233 RepID=A0A8J3Y4Q4_9ACTN|nr:TetR/AcrR family transcriptional regulator [Spirilliplanes yamanashiensis]MDP9819675.1 AcrR family transcriptional regulator [Spirilliplanes yamanashiensis]GIJ01505.1 TetR family transcriptional regulator [Spirilliplanes yamanashiensis]